MNSPNLIKDFEATAAMINKNFSKAICETSRAPKTYILGLLYWLQTASDIEQSKVLEFTYRMYKNLCEF